MRKFMAAMALTAMLPLTFAQAEETLFIAKGMLSPAQAQDMAAAFEEALGETVCVTFEEETGKTLTQSLPSGAGLAVLTAPQAAALARADRLLSLDGYVPALEQMERAYTQACVMDEQLMFAPLKVKQRMMAVRRDGFEAVNMGYLLDNRSHPVWYPAEFVQALDEMAVMNRPGMDVWRPGEEDLPWLSALLCCASELEYMEEGTGACAVDAQEMERALEWMEDMLRAELIREAKDREEALSRFIGGETAVFIDWTQEESRQYAEAIREGEILLRAYPTFAGAPLHAGELVVLCILRGEEAKNEPLRRAAADVLARIGEKETLWQRGLYSDGARVLPLYAAQEYGATLCRLLLDAAGGVIAGEEEASLAAQRMDRAMRTAGLK